jgi:hypothetical protein
MTSSSSVPPVLTCRHHRAATGGRCRCRAGESWQPGSQQTWPVTRHARWSTPTCTMTTSWPASAPGPGCAVPAGSRSPAAPRSAPPIGGVPRLSTDYNHFPARLIPFEPIQSVLSRERHPGASVPRRIWPVYPCGRTKTMARCIANSRVDGPLYWLAEGGVGPRWCSAGCLDPAGPTQPGRLISARVSGRPLGIDHLAQTGADPP